MNHKYPDDSVAAAIRSAASRIVSEKPADTIVHSNLDKELSLTNYKPRIERALEILAMFADSDLMSMSFDSRSELNRELAVAEEGLARVASAKAAELNVVRQ